MIRQALIPLKELRPGDAVNARQHGRKTGLAELVASIKARGLLQPLVVREPARSLTAGGYEQRTYDVADGNRRLEALRKIHGKKDVEVPCVVVDGDEAAAREISLAANVVRAALHPVDEYDAYRTLIDGGMSAADVAAHFGVKEKWVLQRLQLAALAPELRDAWRAGKMTADQAEALSSAPDHARQVAAWKKARDDWQRKPSALRAAVRESGVEQNDGRVAFIGLDAYAAAGGAFSNDLFSEQNLLTDVALVDRLVAEKLKLACAELVAQGWAWAKTDDDLGEGAWRLKELDVLPWLTDKERAKLDKLKSWEGRQKLLDAARDRALADPAARAQSGVVVDLDDDGNIDADYLRVLPAAGQAEEDEGETDDGAAFDDRPNAPDADPKVPAGDNEPEAEPVKVNWTLRETLSEQVTMAAFRALSEAPDVALAVLIASLTVSLRSYSPSPLRLDNRDAWSAITPGRGAEELEERGLDWSTEFAKARALSLDAQLAELARLVATTLDLRAPRYDYRRDWGTARQPIVNALVAALPRERFVAALAECFDPEAYFKRVNIDSCIAALREMKAANGVHAFTTPKKKAEIAAYAASDAKASGWLPPELRTPHYAGPAGENREAAE
jgi:ParB family chromosome partitioning protein